MLKLLHHNNGFQSFMKSLTMF
uniref:Uncharacterized protein n=1 Tax=Tetranychus urticae TaxID=32264 RepID=T1KY99_TETUR